MENALEVEFEGYYGKYKITDADKTEVKRYRIALLCSSISFLIGLSQWIIFGPSYIWIWLLIMSFALGFALKWIHIYIQLIHKTLQILWAVGSLSILILVIQNNTGDIISTIVSNRIALLLISPFFAALTGLGFKEFFCFRRPEAIGVTIFIPICLGSHLLGILNKEIVMILFYFSAILLLVLAIRKFGMDAASDIGDKSVFEYLNTIK